MKFDLLLGETLINPVSCVTLSHSNKKDKNLNTLKPQALQIFVTKISQASFRAELMIVAGILIHDIHRTCFSNLKILNFRKTFSLNATTYAQHTIIQNPI